MKGKHTASTGGEIVSDTQGYIPLYLEGGTVIGKAIVKGNIIEIEVDDETVLDLMGANLIGLSTVSMGARPDPFIEEITIDPEVKHNGT